MRPFYVYILSNRSNTVLYIGITNNLERRIYEHMHQLVDGFTRKYNMGKLVYFEVFDEPISAIAREKTIKNLLRQKKNKLIESINPLWNDLSGDPIASLQDDYKGEFR